MPSTTMQALAEIPAPTREQRAEYATRFAAGEAPATCHTIDETTCGAQTMTITRIGRMLTGVLADGTPVRMTRAAIRFEQPRTLLDDMRPHITDPTQWTTTGDIVTGTATGTSTDGTRRASIIPEDEDLIVEMSTRMTCYAQDRWDVTYRRFYRADQAVAAIIVADEWITR
jgi:hypothetical protein